MADIHITKELLTATIDTLKEEVRLLEDASSGMEECFPEGFTLRHGPPINDSLPAIIEFASTIHARVKGAKAEQRFGPSAKSKRQDRREKK